MRICLFTPTFLPAVGGTEFVTDRLAREFAALGHEPHVLAQGRRAPLDVPYAVHWYPKPFQPRWFPERTARHLAALHDRLRFDIVCCNYANPTGYGALKLHEKTGLPLVIVSHGGDLYHSAGDRQRPHLWRRTVYTYRHAPALIAISPYIVELIRQVAPSPPPIEVIPNGINLRELQLPAQRPADFATDRPFILCLGNLGPLKGFDDAITAYAQVREKLGGAALVVVGSGPLDAALREQARKMGVERDVVFLGKRVGDEKRWLLQHARFGLMPSLEEGHPIVGLEFLASGKPIVCTTNAAFDGMYDDGVNGLRVPARRADLLADAMVKLHHADRDTMGLECRRRAEGYDWPITAGKYISFFERVIRGL